MTIFWQKLMAEWVDTVALHSGKDITSQQCPNKAISCSLGPDQIACVGPFGGGGLRPLDPRLRFILGPREKTATFLTQRKQQMKVFNCSMLQKTLFH